MNYVAPLRPDRTDRLSVAVSPVDWACAGAMALLAICVVSQAGCAWSRGARAAVPHEIARCRELMERGTLAMQQGQVATAEAQFQSAVAANPADVGARRLLGETLWLRGDRAEAIAQLESASRLAPHDAALTVRAGEMLLSTGEVAHAAARADRAIASNPQYGPAWALRGHANWTAGRIKEAVADLQRALVHVPSDERVLLSLATLYLEQHEPRRALTTLHQLEDSAPPGKASQRTLLLEGQAYLALRRPVDAARSLEAAAGSGKPTADIYYLLATAHTQLGRTDAAIRAAHRALAANASHRESLQLLAELNGADHATPAPIRR